MFNTMLKYSNTCWRDD